MFSNSKEGQPVLDAFSIYGRSFSILRIPYALKLLIQELQVMNVQMRIVTEDNVDQLLNLSYQSQNIDKLLGIDHGEDGVAQREISEIIENYKTQMSAKSKIKGKQGNLILGKQNADESAQSLESEGGLRETSFTVGDEVIVKNEETRERFHAVVTKSYSKPPPIYEAYSVLYDDGTTEDNVEVTRMTPDVKTQEYLYAPQSPVEPSPVESSAISSLTDSINTGIRSLDSSLGELGSSVSSSLSGAVDSVSDKIGSINSAISDGSQLEIFDDPQMNDVFNKLSTDKKATIIKMDEEQRKSVMIQIMAAAQQTSSQSGGGLSTYFNGLPVQNQIAALQNTYKSMANEFKQLSGVVNAPQITIVKPQSAAEALYGSTLSIFAPDSGVKKGGSTNDSNKEETNASSKTSEASSSESSSKSSNPSGGFIVKKI